MRAAIYTRQSLDKAGTGTAVARQLADCERLCALRGWTIVARESDNDTSAYSGKKRPGYERIMAMMDDGAIDIVVAWAVDRLTRRLADLLTFITKCEKTGVMTATVSGDLDLSTDTGRLLARILGSVAEGEVERKSTRQKSYEQQAAKTGKPRMGTPRPFGWLPDRVHADPAEAEAIAAGCRAVLAGGTLLGVARDWERRGLRPAQSPFGPLREHPWTRTSVKAILGNPRIAGIRVYNGEEVTRGLWERLVSEDTYRAVREILDNPRWRRPDRASGGPRFTSLLGGIGFCRCGNYITGGRSANGHPSYRCNLETQDYRPGPHVNVKRADVDEHISMAVVARLSAADATGLLARDAEGDVTALMDEELALRSRLARLGSLFAEDKITEADLVSGRARGEARLSEIAAQLAELGRGDVLAPLVAAADITTAWEGLTLELRRAVVDTLMTVTLYPSGSGARTFNPAKVLPIGRGIIWKG